MENTLVFDCIAQPSQREVVCCSFIHIHIHKARKKGAFTAVRLSGSDSEHFPFVIHALYSCQVVWASQPTTATDLQSCSGLRAKIRGSLQNSFVNQTTTTSPCDSDSAPPGKKIPFIAAGVGELLLFLETFTMLSLHSSDLADASRSQIPSPHLRSRQLQIRYCSVRSELVVLES